MTNFERMSEEEKKLAILNGMHLTKDGEYKVCPTYGCLGCKNNHESCSRYVAKHELGTWLNAEYEPLKTENEQFCETLKKGEIIVVWDFYQVKCVRKFLCYDEETDRICCISQGYIEHPNITMFTHGRKLTAEEKGE